MNLAFNRTTLLLIALTAALILTACGGAPPVSSTPSAPTTPTYSVGVTPLSETESANYTNIANADGVAPCGVFNVGGHGPKIALLSDYAACSASSYGVYCLNGEAQWDNSFVSEISLNEDEGTVSFVSAQDGICALFPEN